MGLCFRETCLPSSYPRPDKTEEVFRTIASLNGLVYDVLNSLYVQDLVLASQMKIKKKENKK